MKKIITLLAGLIVCFIVGVCVGKISTVFAADEMNEVDRRTTEISGCISAEGHSLTETMTYVYSVQDAEYIYSNALDGDGCFRVFINPNKLATVKIVIQRLERQ